MRSTFLRRQQEILFASALSGLASELRLIDPGVLAVYIREGLHANLRDVVASSCELLFVENSWRYGGRAHAALSWTGTPEFSIDLEFARPGLCAFMSLHLHAYHAFVHLHHIAMPGDPEQGESMLARAIADSQLVSRPA